MKNFYTFRLLALFSLISAVILINSCDTTPTGPKESDMIKGVLIDQRGEAIPGAIMEIVATQTAKNVVLEERIIERDTSDEDGNFSFRKIPENIDGVDLRIIHPDMKPYQEYLETIIMGKDRADLQLAAEYQDSCCGKIIVNVYSAKDSSSIQGVEIRLNVESTLKRKGVSQENGSYTFNEVCKYEYWLRLSKSGYEVREISGIAVDGCEESDYVEVNVYMTPENRDSCCDGMLKVIPKDSESGEVLKGVTVKLRKNGVELKKKVNEGDYVLFEELCEGEYELAILKDGYVGQEVSVNIDCDEDKELVVQMEKRECCEGVINLKVVDDSTKAGIKEAQVRLFKSGTKLGVYYTNADGIIKLTGLCEGEYGLDVIREGYKAIEFTQKIECNDTVDITKSLLKSTPDSCCQGIVKIYPKDSKTKESLNGALVKLFKNGALIEKVEVKEGKAVFDGLCEGKYSFLIMKDGYQSMDFSVEVDCNETYEYEKFLVSNNTQDSCCDGIVKVYVRDENGKAINGAKVILWKDGKAIADPRTNADGFAAIDGLCEGKYQISIQMDGYKGQEFNFELGCDETKAFEKVLVKNEQDSCCKGIIKVYARDENGNAIQNAKVILWKNGKAIADPRTNADGYAVVDGLCEGAYGVSIQLEGYKGVEFEYNLDCNESKTFEKTLVKNSQDTCCNGKIKVSIKDEDGKALAYVMTRLTKSGKEIGDGQTNGDGQIAFEKLCEGTYVLRLSKDGYKVIEMEIKVDCNEVLEISKTMQRADSCCTAILKLTIKDSEGKAINTANVILYKGGKEVGDGQTNADGLWAEDGLCAPSDYVVVVKKDGYKDKEFKISYDWCKTIMETVKLEKE